VVDTIGRYRVIAEIGRGGGGIVYKATDPETNEEVAIKTVPAGDSFGAGRHTLVERLRREAQSASSLVHPNIVQVRELAEDGPQIYFVMEFVHGATLEDMLRRREELTPDEAISILKQAAQALDYAHRRGVVHRDIKPANIMVNADRNVKITDFGTAKLLTGEGGAQLTVAGTMLGTPHYMSPEQVTESGVDGRSDQFSLGVIAYELLTGRKPFEGDFAPSVLYQIVSEPAPRVDSIRPELPSEVDAVLQRALGKKRIERYSCCVEFVQALDDALNSRGNEQPSVVAAAPDSAAAEVAAVCENETPAAPLDHPQQRRPWWRFVWDRLRFGSRRKH
jgi:serine/threonine protein kinase